MATSTASTRLKFHARYLGLVFWLSGVAAAADVAPLPSKPAAVTDAGWASITQQVQRELYAASPDQAGVLQAYNRGQRLSLSFAAQGPEAKTDRNRAALQFNLLGYGYGAALTPVTTTAPVAAKNRIEYRHGPLVEWYVNRPEGLEQGFTLASRPSSPAPSAGLLRLEIGVKTGLSVQPQAGGSLVFVDAKGGKHFAFGGFSAIDARGRKLPAKMEVISGGTTDPRIALVVNDRSATYPVTLDPTLLSLEQEISVPYQTTIGASANLGASVAMSGDGQTLIVGVSNGNGGLVTGAGLAFIFKLTNSAWQLQAEITGDKQDGYSFGTSAALNATGTVALVGSDAATVGTNTQAGDAFVFSLVNGVWTKETKLTASDNEQGANFADALALSGDGLTAVIGAFQSGSGSQSNGIPIGAAYVFRNTGAITAWTQEAKLTDPSTEGPGAFGLAVAISGTSGSGQTILVGAPADNNLGGLAFAFASNSAGTTWTPFAAQNGGQTGALPVPSNVTDGTNINYGLAVAISSDGKTALIGAPNAFNGNSAAVLPHGTAYVVTYGTSSWNAPVQLAVAGDAANNDTFGVSVAISGTSATGQVAVVGSSYGDPVISNNSFVPSSSSGSAYVYVYNGATWAATAELKASDAASQAGQVFGLAVATDSAGDTAIAGAPFSTVAGLAQAGSAYVYSQGTGTPWSSPVQSIELTGADFEQSQSGGIGTSVAMASDTQLVLGFPGAVANGASGMGLAAVFGYASGSWTETAILTASDGTPNANFGSAVGIATNGTVVVGASQPNGANGEAYVFAYNATNGTYSRQGAALTASDGTASAGFGSAVAISADGATVLVGAPSAGHAYVFTFATPNWTQSAELSAIDGGAGFGAAVSLSGTSGNGQVAVVGAANASPSSAAKAGEAYVFTLNTGNNIWGQRSPLTADTPVQNANFGAAVSVSGDATTLLIGAPAASSAGAAAGTVYAFVNGSGSFTLANKQSDTSLGGGFGSSVAVSSNGQLAVVGSSSLTPAGGSASGIGGAGAVYAFAPTDGSSWISGFAQQGSTFYASDSVANEFLGTAVAISPDGLLALAGAPGSNFLGIANSGAAYVFSLAPVSITSATTAQVIANTPSSSWYQATASGGTGSYTFSLASGSNALPSGLSLSSSGVLSGTPASGAVGTTTTVTLQATDGSSNSAQISLAITVNTLGITSRLTPTPVSGVAFNYTLTATGGTGSYTYSIVGGSLPTGLSLSGAAITGTPSVTGTFPVTIQVKDSSNNTSSYTITFTVNVVGITSAASVIAIQNNFFNYQTTAVGGTTPYTFSLASGSNALPAGLSLNSSSGLISGTPTALGSTKVLLKVSDLNGNTAQSSLTITADVIGITSSSSATAIKGSNFFYSINAGGGTGGNTYGVNGTLPSGLALSASNGTISGTPTATGTTTVTIRVTDNSSDSASASLTITVNTIGITSSTSTSGVKNVAFSFQATALGGTPAYAFGLASASNPLPAGLSLSSNGLISGTPTATGTTTVTLKVVDSVGNNASANLAIVISSLGFTGASNATGVAGFAFSYQATAAGGTAPYTFALAGNSNTLPSGLSISAAGLISGIPTATGNASVTLMVTDHTSLTAQTQVTITINTLGLTSAASISGSTGTSLSYQATEEGGTAPFTYSITSGSLPTGLSLTSSSGLIGGTPTQSSNSNVTLTVTDKNGNSAQQFISFSIVAALGITSPSSASAIVGSPFNYQLTATGGAGSYTYSLASGSNPLPAGLGLNSSGGINGTPTATGTTTVTLQVTDGASNTAQLSFTLAVATVGITSASSAQGVENNALSFQITANGGTTPYTFAETGTLPAGVTLNPSTGILSGTPTAIGTFPITLTATDSSSNSIQAAFTLAINTVGITNSAQTSIPGFVGVGFNVPLTAAGGTSPYIFSIVSGSLPAGLSLVGGNIIGTPTATGFSSVTFKVVDNASNQSQTTLNFNIQTLGITSGTDLTAISGTAFNYQATVAGGTSPFTFSLASGTLPAGLTLASTGLISGTPTATGNVSFSLQVTDSATPKANVASQLIFINVAQALTITSPGSANAFVGTPFSYQASVNGGATPIAYTITNSSLPAGLTMSGAGLISGSPTTAGNYGFTLTATDANNATANLPISLTVSVVGPSFSVQLPPSLNDILGTTIELTATAAGTPSYQWFFNGQSLSNGAEANGSTIAGATSNTLTVTGAQAANLGSYTVVASAGGGSTTSTASSVTASAGYYFTTVAGLTPAGSTNGPGSSAQFNMPFGTAVDSSGNVYVADENNFVIRKLTPSAAGGVGPWTVSTFAGMTGTSGSNDGTLATAQFTDAGGLTFDAHGNLFVSDQFKTGGTIREITTAGNVVTIAGTAGVTGSAEGTGASIQFDAPAQMAFDSAGDLYVADELNAVIRMLTPTTVNGTTTWTSTTIAGLAGSTGTANGAGSAARFNEPEGLVIDQTTGILYVSERLNFSVRAITPSTPTPGAGTTWMVSTLAGLPGTAGSTDGAAGAARFEGPFYMALVGSGSSGLLYVCDGLDYAIRTVALSTGQVTTVAGDTLFSGFHDGTGSAVLFGEPSSIAMDGAGNAYIVDFVNQMVRQMVLQTNTVTTIAGITDGVDGTGAAARLGGPEDIAVDGSGNLYVADTFDFTIRKVTGGVVTTIAGTNGVPGTADGIGAAAIGLDIPGGVAVDPTGNVYVADTGNDTIRQLTPATANGVTTYTSTTIAGAIKVSSEANGAGGTARFNRPASVAYGVYQGVPMLFVADSSGDTIREIVLSTGLVSTLAGTPAGAGGAGYLNGTGSAARFNKPSHVVYDGSANLYVTDSTNNVIRKVAIGTGVVTTAVGAQTSGVAAAAGAVDGSASTAELDDPVGLAIDSHGNLYVADARSELIREYASSSGAVSTLAGTFLVAGSADGVGSASQFRQPSGIAIDAAGNLYVADANNNEIREGVPAAAPAFTAQPVAQAVTYGAAAAEFTGTATGAPAPGYQWQVSTDGGNTFSNLSDGNGVSGSGTAALTVAGATVAMSGDEYQLVASNAAGRVASSPVALTVNKAQAIVSFNSSTLSQTYAGSPLAVTAASNPSGLALAVTYSAAGGGTASAQAPTSAGSYTVFATVGDPNYAGTSTATLTIAQATPVVTWSPPATIGTGVALSSAQLDATASVPGSFTYTPAAGTVFAAPGGTALMATFVPADSTDYATVNSGATITVVQIVPAISTQPATQTVNSGSAVTFTVTTAGTGPFTFQWQQNGNLVNAGVVSSGATSTLTLSNVGAASAGSYNVLVTNSFGQTTSSTATLTVNLVGTPPSITQQIATQTVSSGATVSFTVVAAGDAPLAFAWSQNGTALTSGVSSSGGTSTLTLAGVTTASSGAYTVVVTNAVGGASSSASLTVNPAVAVPVIVSGFTAAGTVGSPFSYMIVAANHPTSFSAANLPAGLSVNTTTGAITGTPTVAGSFSVAIGAAVGSVSGSATLALTIQQPVPVINSSSVASGRVGSTFANYTVTASNSPTSFSATGLPTGLSLDSKTGIISGTPALPPGSFPVSLTASNGTGTSAAFTLTLTIAPSLAVPAVSSSPTASGTAGVAFAEYDIAASNTPTSFNATGLPAGLTVNTATGAITGTPTVSGIFTVLVTAANASGTSPTLILTITIAPAASAPVINSNLSAGATFGVSFSYPITATNTPTSFSATGLPAGLSLATSTGIISGTPTVAGTFNAALGATNASGTGTATLVLTVAPGFAVPVISSSSQVSGQVGVSFSYTILANNTPTSFAATGLPSGLTLSTTSGVITGTPAVAGTFSVSLTASNATGTGQPFVLTVTVAAALQAPAITSAATASGKVGVLLTYVITTNLAATSYAATGLPAGLSIDPVAGIISGTPIAVGTTTASITASNSSGAGAPLTLIFAIGANSQSPAITSSTTASGTQGQPFTYTVTASNMPSGATLPAGDGYSATGLPAGLGINPSTGIISGTPVNVGTSSVVLTATNDTGGSAPLILTLTINPAANAPSVTSGNTAGAAVGTAFGYQITAIPAATSYAVTGNPSWLGINTAVGILAGTPNGAPGNYVVLLTATNAAGTSSPLPLTITVAAAAGTPVVTSSVSPAAGTAGVAYPDTAAGALYQIQALPSAQIQSYFVNTALPAGLSLDPAQGLIYGTPSIPGTYTVSVGASNLIGIGAATDVILTINAAPGTPTISNAGGSSSSALARGEISAEDLPTASGTVGTAFSYQIQASGTPTSYAASGLPPGLAVNPSTGTITGIPSTAGTFTSLVSASNGIGVGASTNLIITISPPATAPTVSSSPTATAIAGTPFTYAMAASNAPTSYNASGLPAGLSLDSSTGVISGTPTTPGVDTVSLSANNASGTGPVLSLTLTVASAVGAPAITSVSTTAGTVAAAFSAYQVTASNGPITSYAAINLPAGLAIDPVGGAITGTPTTAGTYVATLTATNATGPSSPFALLVTVAPAATSSSISSAASTSVTSGAAFSYQIAGTNAPLSYNVTGLPSGVTVNTSTGVISGAISGAGAYTVTISANNATGTGASSTLTINVTNPNSYARLTNLSARAYVGTGSGILIAGFGISGSGTKQVLVRGVGPEMFTLFGITDNLTNANLAIYDSGPPAQASETGSTVIASENGWANNPTPGTSIVSSTNVVASASLMTSLGAFGYEPNSLDSAILSTLPVGNYTVQVSGVGGTSGVALAELYDNDSGIPSGRLVNIAARSAVGTGFNILIAGFGITGNTSETVLIRGVGPRLGEAPFYLAGTLASPQLTLYDSVGTGHIIASNSGWSTAPTTGPSTVVAIVQPASATVMATVGAFPLDVGSNDAAMEVTLPPGNYTAQLSGVGGTIGIGLIEVYEVP